MREGGASSLARFDELAERSGRADTERLAKKPFPDAFAEAGLLDKRIVAAEKAQATHVSIVSTVEPEESERESKSIEEE